MRVRWSHRPRNAVMGRFGGGWQWALGFRYGGRTLMIELLVGSLLIERPPRPRDLYEALGRPDSSFYPGDFQ